MVAPLHDPASESIDRQDGSAAIDDAGHDGAAVEAENAAAPTRPRHWTFWAEPAVLFAVVAAAAATALIVPDLGRQALLSPTVVAALLLLNLLPSLALMVLIGRRVALRRARKRGGGDAVLHTRLVALFSATAAVPTLLVVVISAVLFQSGMEFWFSDRSRGMFENAVSVAQNFFENEKRDVGANTLAMATDLRSEIGRAPIESQNFYDFYIQQVVVRELSESAIIQIGDDGVARTLALIDPVNRAVDNRLPTVIQRRLDRGEQLVTRETGDGVEAVVKLLPEQRLYLYAGRGSTVLGLESMQRARSVFADYNLLFARSRELQFRFILALYIGSLVVVGLVIVAAILVADRIVRPIDALVSAARRVASGNLEVRVAIPAGRPDEIATLSGSFNTMTGRLREQTGALLDANEQIEGRRAFIEAVLSSVASGVVSLDPQRRVSFVNSAAAQMIRQPATALTGQPLAAIVPALDDWIVGETVDPIISVDISGEARTWAAKMASDDNGYVLTLEDITQQLLDQRRAAWSDVARRVAHEIKNPLTPIQLAAERLQRKFGPAQAGESDTFNRLTSTIIRQVGDLRRMVDEFSSFARMPKPQFREDNIGDALRQSLFLMEVAKPDIAFTVTLPDDLAPVVCDRRLLGQAFTNLFKNAVEAVERTGRNDGAVSAEMTLTGDRLDIVICDNGVGLPPERSAITEPYVTTRDGGTGLGLAIVKKIVEEHGGSLAFGDCADGGTQVRIVLWPRQLADRACVDAEGEIRPERRE